MEDGGAVHKNVYVLRFVSSVTVLRFKRVVGFAWIWIGIWFVNMWSWTWNHHSFHHLSSPPVIIFEEIKMFCFIKYHWIFKGFASFDFAMRISVWKLVRVSRCKYGVFVIILCLLSCLFHIIAYFKLFILLFYYKLFKLSNISIGLSL